MEENRKIEVEKINGFFNEEDSKEGRLYLNDIFCDNDKAKELEQILRKQWFDKLTENDIKEEHLDHILYRIHYNINHKKLKPQSTLLKFADWFSRIAAILILPLLLYTGINLYRSSIKGDINWVEIKAPAWTRAHFTLPDGTNGWLNSNSSIRYKGDYNYAREVMLNGEAYFDVKTDQKRPFVVNTSGAIVTAVGTRFNVASYEEENEVEVVLEEGKLLFSNDKKGEILTIAPNERLLYNKTQDTYSTDTVQIEKHTSWTEGKLIFRNDPIDVIVRRLGRWYNVDVELVNNNFKEIMLRATFEDENLEEVLFYLEKTLDIECKIIEGNMMENGDVYVKKKVLISSKQENNNHL